MYFSSRALARQKTTREVCAHTPLRRNHNKIRTATTRLTHARHCVRSGNVQSKQAAARQCRPSCVTEVLAPSSPIGKNNASDCCWSVCGISVTNDSSRSPPPPTWTGAVCVCGGVAENRIPYLHSDAEIDGRHSHLATFSGSVRITVRNCAESLTAPALLSCSFPNDFP